MAVAFTVQPADRSREVDPSASLFVTLRADTGTLDAAGLDVTIGGVAAVVDGVVQSPAFAGEVHAQGALVTVAVRPRRRFLYGVNVAVVVAVPEVVGLASTTYTSTTAFATRDRAARLLDPGLRATRVDQLFTDAPALELHRVTALGALAGAPDAAAVVLLYHRVRASSLRPMAASLALPPGLDAEVARLRPADVASLVDVDARLEAVRALWEPALRELLALGASPPEVQLLLRAGNSGSFQERVAAACTALLLAAALLRRREGAPVYVPVNQAGG